MCGKLRPNAGSAESGFGLLRSLAHDKGGNTMAMVAAGMAPLLAMIGGGIDIGRSYLAENRLQQACDAGVLAARKKLGSTIVVAEVPADVIDAGNRFFNANYRDGSYGTEERDFAMTLEDDNAISGIATAVVPTTVMRVFGKEEVNVAVGCEARLNFSNTDIMMAIDTTGSMNELVPDTAETRIDAVRRVVKSFYDEIEGNKSPGTRVRYGFVPYSSNVNVGGLLKSKWFVDKHDYRSRIPIDKGETRDIWSSKAQYTYISGNVVDFTLGYMDYCPADTYTWDSVLLTVENEGLENERRTYQTVDNGKTHSCAYSDGKYYVTGYDYIKFTNKASYWNELATLPVIQWVYDSVEYDVSGFKNADPELPPSGGKISPAIGSITPSGPSPVEAWYRGCIEEAKTAEIDDYSNIPTNVFDLNINHVPDEGDADTQWKPSLYELIWMPRKDTSGASGNFERYTTPTTDEYWHPWWDYGFCPTYSRDLEEISPADLTQYLDNMYVGGATYHDIGLLWGARLLSPNGIKADLNANVDGRATSRHLIFLTDGVTMSNMLTYGAYGAEPLDERRCSGGDCNEAGINKIIEERFSHICQQTLNENITIWIIGFGTEVPQFMRECAGPGHWFEAQDASKLQASFSNIAKSIGDLRVSR